MEISDLEENLRVLSWRIKLINKDMFILDMNWLFLKGLIDLLVKLEKLCGVFYCV